MKKIKIEMQVTSFDHTDQLPKTYQKLLFAAHTATNESYAPYSNFRVGAAVLLKNGEIVKGANQENAAYPLCLCAERTALAAASSNFPNMPIVAIAVTAHSDSKDLNHPIAPCGSCRQVITETEQRYKLPMQVLMQGESGPIYQLDSGKDLLPLGFSSKYL